MNVKLKYDELSNSTSYNQEHGIVETFGSMSGIEGQSRLRRSMFVFGRADVVLNEFPRFASVPRNVRLTGRDEVGSESAGAGFRQVEQENRYHEPELGNY